MSLLVSHAGHAVSSVSGCASGRRPLSLQQLRLDGSRVFATNSTTNFTVEGTISRGGISYVANGTESLHKLEEFGQLVGIKPSAVWDFVYLEREGTRFSLAEIRQDDQRFYEGEKKGLQSRLLKTGLNSYDDLLGLHRHFSQGRPPAQRFVYRVVPPAYPYTGGDLQPRSPKRFISALDFLVGINDHIRNGSRVNSTFLSATTDIGIAMWWSHSGTFTVLELDTVKASKVGAVCWDVGAAHSEFIYEGIHRRYAESSREVLFYGTIPAAAVRILPVKWECTSVLLSNPPKRKKCFPNPKSLNATAINLIAELNGSTHPLHIQMHVGRTPEQGPDSDPATVPQNGFATPTKGKQKARLTPHSLSTQPDMQQFVMKHGGRTHDSQDHVASEFFALVCYDGMGLRVPQAALYLVQVTVPARPGGVDVLYSKQHHILLTQYKLPAPGRTIGNDHSLQSTVAQGLAADVVLANYDIAGPDFNNLLVDASDPTTVWRVDAGGCFEFTPVGTRKRQGAEFLSTQDGVLSTITKMRHGGGKEPADRDRRALFKLVTDDQLRQQAAHMAETLRFDHHIASCLLRFEKHLPYFGAWATEAQLRLGHLAAAHSTPIVSIWAKDGAIASFHNAKHRRIQAAMDGGPAKRTNSGAMLPPSIPCPPKPKFAATPPEPADGLPLVADAVPGGSGEGAATPIAGQSPQYDIVVVGRSANTEIKRLEGYYVLDVTSQSDDPLGKLFSPFAATLRPVIPVPQNEKYKSYSVEGVWQGLKIFPTKGAAYSKFDIRNGKKLKRTNRSNGGKPLGHEYGQDERGQPRILNYQDARKLIYIPTYRYVLDNHLQPQVTELKRTLDAHGNKLVLKDYYTNSDVSNEKTPLSHAHLLKAYLNGCYPTYSEEPAQAPQCT